MGSVSFCWSCKFIIKQTIQSWVIQEISLCFLDALCVSLYLSCLISSLSHVFFFLKGGGGVITSNADLVTYSTLFNCEVVHMQTYVCVWKDEEETKV